jgi:tripartite-type tricarboxylate transporter receptor subunit TctC
LIETALRGRRAFSRFALALAILAPVAPAHAQAPYPNKPVKLVVGFPPGGGMDLTARVFAAKLQEALGVAVVVENKPGGSGFLAGDAVAKASPDGYTLLVGASGQMTINPALFANLPYDPVKDFAPITVLATFPMVIAVNASVPVKTLAEFIALARSRPGEIAYSHGGAAHQVAGEMLAQAAGIRLRNIPYKGGAPAVNAAVAGDVPAVVVDIGPVLPQLRAGRLRVLAVTSAERTPLAPDFPTVAEAGLPGYAISIWAGLFAPAGTPASVLARLFEETSRAIAAADTKERLKGIGMDPGGMPSAQLAALVRAEIERYRVIVKAANIKAE